MKIDIRPIYESATERSLHLRISTPDGNCYNFRVPSAIGGCHDEFSFVYPYEPMRALHELLDKYINRNHGQIIPPITRE